MTGGRPWQRALAPAPGALSLGANIKDRAVSDETKGTILRAENGDVIRYDETGVSLRLSDRVVEDLALRLGLGAPPPEPPAPPAPPAGLDAWDARWAGDWLLFQARLPGAQGPRGFRQHRDGGAILAQAAGPVLGLLELGGPSAALADPGAPRFPYHILAPADDIGAVGLGGIEPAEPRATLEPLRERTHGALVAEALLDQAMASHMPPCPCSSRVPRPKPPRPPPIWREAWRLRTC